MIRRRRFDWRCSCGRRSYSYEFVRDYSHDSVCRRCGTGPTVQMLETMHEVK